MPAVQRLLSLQQPIQPEQTGARGANAYRAPAILPSQLCLIFESVARKARHRLENMYYWNLD